MEVKLNGKQTPVLGKSETVQLTELLEQLGFKTDVKGIAIAVNLSVIPRSEWESMLINTGDEVEVIGAQQGG